MSDPILEQIRDHICPYDGAHCWEFQNELDRRKNFAESLGIRFRENMFVHPGEDFFAECPKINTDGFNCARYNMWLKNIQMESNKRILVGKIVAPQGIRGEVRVQTFTAAPSDFKDLAVFGDNIAVGTFHFARDVPHSNVIIARIDGVADRNTAETLRGTELFINRESLPATKNGEYYQADLIGMTVVRSGAELGRVACFQNFGAGDIIELDNGDMISFNGAIVNMKKQTITVK